MLSFKGLALVIVSVQSIKTLIKTEVGTRDWGIAVIVLTMLFWEKSGFGDFGKQWNALIWA